MSSYINPYDMDLGSPALVIDQHRCIIGAVTQWNQHGLGEAIVQFFDGSADSAIFSELTFVNGADAARDYLDSKER